MNNTQTTIQDDKETKEILKVFNSLPKIVQDAILKSGWEKAIRNLVSKYRLRIDQGTKLENMTFALMMAELDSKRYYEILHSDFGLDKDSADALFTDIDDQIFANIQDVIIKLEKDEEQKAKEEEKPSKSTYMKEEREINRKDDEILTATREEILRDIENPEKIDMSNNLSDLKGSTVMPKQVNSNVAPKEGFSMPKVENKTVEVRENQIPSNLPTFTPPKPINPVDAGLTNKVSTSNKTYQSDPYREPLE